MGNRTFAEQARSAAALALKWLALWMAFSFAVSPFLFAGLPFEQALIGAGAASFVAAVVWNSLAPPKAAVRPTAKGFAGRLLAGLGWTLLVPAVIWAPIAWLAASDAYRGATSGFPFEALAIAFGVVAAPVLMIWAGRKTAASKNDNN